MTSNDTTVNDGVSQKAISKRATSNRIGRPSRKDYDATTILQNQIAIVREVYDACQEIKATAAELNLAELKVRKLLITGNIISYEQTDTITSLQKEGKTLQQIMEITGLSRASINGYLPYTKVPYKESEISSNAEWCNAYRNRKAAVEALQEELSEGKLWDCIIAFQGYLFRTVTGLKYSYTLKKGRNGDYTKELFIDRRESSKSLAWSSILLAMQKVDADTVYEKPKAIGDIRGISYIYPMLWRFRLIKVPEEVEQKLRGKGVGKKQTKK